MKHLSHLLLFFFLQLFVLPLFNLNASTIPQTAQEIPVSYKGRYRAFHAYSALWLYELHHSTTLKKIDSIHNLKSPEEFLWLLHLKGHHPFDDVPIFYISSSEVKSLLDLDLHTDRFSYQQLHQAFYDTPHSSLSVMKQLITSQFTAAYLNPINRSMSERFELSSLSPGLWVGLKADDLLILATPTSPPWNTLQPGNVLIPNFRSRIRPNNQKEISTFLMELMGQITSFSTLDGDSHFIEKQLANMVEQLNKTNTPPKEIAYLIDQHFPFHQRLQAAGSLIKVLPSAAYPGEWYSLHALKLKIYNPLSKELIPIKNFTPYTDELFGQIQSAYEKLENEFSTKNLDQIATLLNQGYATIAGTPIKNAENKILYYPTQKQLKAEVIYYSYPWTEWCIFLYSMALLVQLFARSRTKPLFQNTAFICLLFAFTLHTFILGIRCYILNRPPVSNMFETVIYVPWIAVLTGFILRYATRSLIPLVGASTVSILLLIILKITNVNSSLENVQAVLDSQFWLIIHVLMIVGSYGVFALSGVLAHLYLMGWKSQEMTRCIQQGLYIGIALLIPGTILGGVWAAQSWGRFWDWDPKESWAFITSCVYLIVIHAYTFRRIRAFGLAVGAIAGLLAVSFTWYGVNYLLGTGLHSYGFGTGGMTYYFVYIAFEFIFLGSVWILHYKNSGPSKKYTETM